MGKSTKRSMMNAYHWCERHMAWTMHSPKECRLGKERKEEKALSATVTAAATTAVNPSYQALLSALSRFQDKE
jgi:hypothetical protein